MAISNVSISKAFKSIIFPRWRTLAWGFLLIVISRIAGIALPISTKYIIDDVILEKDMRLLWQLIIAIVVALSFQAVSSFLLTRILSVEAQHLIAELRVRIQRHIMKLPIHFFDNARAGELVSRIMTDVEGVRNLVGTGFVQLIGGILAAALSLYFLISISPFMTLSVLVPVSIFGIISLKAFSYIRPVFRDRGKINAEVTARLVETINGIRVIKGFNAEPQEIKVFEKGTERIFTNIKKSLTTTAMITSSGTFLLGMASVGVLGIGGYLILENELTIGELISFTMFLGFMMAPIVQMGNIGSQITEAFAGLDRMGEVMSIEGEDNGHDRKVHLPRITGDIRFEHVCFAYEKGKQVLNDINFHAKAGSVTALVGTSGAGKSTIAALVTSFLVSGNGHILVDGQDLSKIKLNDYRKHLGVVLQDEFLFDGTIRENILFPRPGACDEELADAVSAAHVAEFTDRFEYGLDTIIGERGVKLSGGQRQRLAIARAILADPKILILDEATSNLDTESESMIQQSLTNLMKGRTTFIIAHRLSTIKKADQILVIENGEIAERGNHDQLIEHKGRYYELYTFQARI